MPAKLWTLPLDLQMRILFYVPTKELPSFAATHWYFARLSREYLLRRRDALEAAEKPLAKRLERLVDWKTDDTKENQYRFDDISELFDKCHDGLDVMR